MEQRPPCELCGSPSLVFMLDKYFCGVCVANWDRAQKENILKDMKNQFINQTSKGLD